MHFFIHTDNSNIPDQGTSDICGPDSSDPTNKFNLTSLFQLTGQTKAFACQDSMMIVQQSSVDSSLVNVILKPIEGLKIPFRSVKYFVYRGLLKNSFISGTAIAPQATGNSEFITRFWADWNNYKTSSNQPTLTDPTPQSFGYDTSLSGSLDVEKIYDNSQTDVRALLVKEGEWFGDFGSSFKIGFEIITEADSLTLDLDFLRTEKFQIDVTGLSGLALRAEREKILSFIDPAAFFGLHYDAGVNITIYGSGGNKVVQKKKQNDLYTTLLDNKFGTRNTVYLDIRSEKGFSYNFYQNYDNGSGSNIKIGNSATTPAEQVYEYSGWPIVVVNSPLATTAAKNDIKINLRVDDNTKPILFFENTNLLNGNNRSPFIDETKILNGAGWSKDLSFVFPNTGTGSSKDNVAYYINLNYFRQEFNSSSPGTVLKNENYFDSAFCPIDLPNLADTNYLFNQVHNPDLNFVRGQLPGITNDFGYVAGNGAFWDTSRIVFFSQAIFQKKNTQQFFDSIANWGLNFGFNLDGNFNKMSFLSKDIQVAKTNIQEDIGAGLYQKIKLLDIVNYNGFPNAYENVFCLGITQTELTALKNISGFSDKHHRYIYIEELSGSPFTDKDGKPFRKFKLKVQGLASSGNQLILAPSSDIYIYNQLGLVFASKDFADQETNQLGLVYKRNYEENIGYSNIEPTTNKHYEDYFIDIDSGMRTEVDGFINTLATVANDANAYTNIKSLVEDSAKDIWDEAVSFVQANSNANPDDRPLYWARNKMEVALKSHPYFENQFLFSDVNPGSELEAMVKLFEEKSRNYTGVDFSGAPLGAKKILITGFDPFFLNPAKQDNILQSNPSGASNLALHNKTIISGAKTGFIQSVIFPVRFFDFDKGVVERLVYPLLFNNSVDLIITISQGAVNYDIERFAAKYRNPNPTHYDNLGKNNIPAIYYLPDTSNTLQVVSSTSLANFLETTLPYTSIVPGTLGNNVVVFNQRYTTENSSYQAPYSGTGSGTNLITAPPSNLKAKYGSGGDYLSNEIFYRVSDIRNKVNSSFRSGHLHVPALQIGQVDIDYIKTKNLISNVQVILQDALSAL
jgi:pyrrolidone-carboxylate peptidase